MRKKKSNLKLKHSEHILFKATDTKNAGTVTIEGFANKAIVDRGNDIIDPDAFELDNYLKNPIMFFNHDPMLEIGAVTEIAKTDEGLRIKAMISDSDDDFTKRVRNNIKQGILKSLSVGFEPLDMDENKDGVNVIKKAELMEISVVGIPCNQDSIFNVTSKSQKELDKLYKKDRKAWACKMLDAMVELQKKSESEQADTQKENENKMYLEGKTSESMGHYHMAKVENQNGNGIADTVMGEYEPHIHEIKDGKVLPGGDDGHTHTINMGDFKEPELVEENETAEKSNCDDEDKKEKQTESMIIQSLIFNKDKFSQDEAIKWASEHGFENDKVDDTEGSYRLRQREPDMFVADSFKTIEIKEGLMAVIGQLAESIEAGMDNEDEDKKSFNDIVVKCLYDLIINKNATSDDAVTEAIEVATQIKKQPISREHFKLYFNIADALLNTKQAGQEQVENIPTTPIDTDVTRGELQDPHLDTAKQTNVLLGTLINEMQLLRAQVSQLMSNDERQQNGNPKEQENNQELLSSQNEANIDLEANKVERALLDVSKKYVSDLHKRLKNLGV